MKNLDRIYGLSRSQSLLDELSTRVNIDYFIRSQSNQLLSTYKETKKNWDESDSEYIVRVAIFVASKLRAPSSDNSNTISLSSILKDLPSLHDYMVKLKDFITVIPLDSRIKADMQSIISNYAFSLTLFNKFEELWNSVVDASQGMEDLKQIAWSIFLLSRVNLLQRRSEIVECACMLVAVIQVAITNSDKEQFIKYRKNEQECLNYLCSLIKGQPESVKISATHLKKMLELFIQHAVIKSDSGLAGIFRETEIAGNYEKLSLEYVHKLLPSEFDQRLFIDKSDIYEKEANINCRFLIKDCLYLDFQGVSVNTELNEIQYNNRIFSDKIPSDLEIWLEEYTKGVELDEETKEIISQSLFNLKIKPHVDSYSGTFSKVYFRIQEFCEEAPPEHIHQVALAGSLIIFSIIFKIKAIDLDLIFSSLEISAYELWKLLKQLAISPVPRSLYCSLKEQQILISTSYAWKDKKFMAQFKSFVACKKENLQMDIKDFTYELLYYSSFAIKELCRMLYLAEKVQEEIWQMFKSSLLATCEMLINRNLHQIIICSIYGLSKAKGLNVTFNSIINRFIEIDTISENLFRKIRIDDGTGDIIRYYNDEYLKYMKSYLLSASRSVTRESYSTPLGISNATINPVAFSLSAQSPINACSPYLTPAMRKVYEFGESPVESLSSFNQMISRNHHNILSFEEEKIGMPMKKPKLADEIYKDDEIGENLPEDIPGFKEDTI